MPAGESAPTTAPRSSRSPGQASPLWRGTSARDMGESNCAAEPSTGRARRRLYRAGSSKRAPLSGDFVAVTAACGGSDRAAASQHNQDERSGASISCSGRPTAQSEAFNNLWPPHDCAVTRTHPIYGDCPGRAGRRTRGRRADPRTLRAAGPPPISRAGAMELEYALQAAQASWIRSLGRARGFMDGECVGARRRFRARCSLRAGIEPGAAAAARREAPGLRLLGTVRPRRPAWWRARFSTRASRA